ncbi:hypothetical protein [Pseudomonas sp. 21LCFQ02]|nr:hypothetical protein [Pseudomonas sp. 21LCFQ02]
MSLPHHYQNLTKTLSTSRSYQAWDLPCAVDPNIRAVWSLA